MYYSKVQYCALVCTLYYLAFEIKQYGAHPCCLFFMVVQVYNSLY